MKLFGIVLLFFSLLTLILLLGNTPNSSSKVLEVNGAQKQHKNLSYHKIVAEQNSQILKSPRNLQLHGDIWFAFTAIGIIGIYLVVKNNFRVKLHNN